MRSDGLFLSVCMRRVEEIFFFHTIKRLLVCGIDSGADIWTCVNENGVCRGVLCEWRQAQSRNLLFKVLIMEGKNISNKKGEEKTARRNRYSEGKSPHKHARQTHSMCCWRKIAIEKRKESRIKNVLVLLCTVGSLETFRPYRFVQNCTFLIFNAVAVGNTCTRIRLKICAAPFLLQSLCTPMLFDGWLIDWVRGYASKSAQPRFCFKVCALPCYSMVDWLIEYEEMPQSLGTPFLLQSLRTPMLFDGWLIDWVRGYASKSAHPRFCFKVCTLPCYSMVDWLIEYEEMPQSAHFKNWHFPETHRPNSANSSLFTGLVIILHIKRKWRQNLGQFFTKNGKKYNQRLLNQSINHQNT